jgi:hypothetical protein
MVGKILSAIASAIDHAHSHKVVHRDIKPGNVLLRSASGPVSTDHPLPDNVEPILTDFGLVRVLDSSAHTTTGNVTGTPAYMSPEQARGDKITNKTDIYSLGIMLYEMLAGAVPFDAESSFGVLMKHLNDPPPPIFGISSNLQFIINRALAKDPDIRYNTATELADEFMAVLHGQAVSEDTIKLLEAASQPAAPPQKQSLPYRWAWIGAGIILILALVIGSFEYFRSASTNKDQPVGRVSFEDFSWVMDRVVITTSGLSKPKAGTHYDVWLLAQDGEIRKNIGTLNLDESGQGFLSFTDPNQIDLLVTFDQVEITREADNDPKPGESSGETAASSVFPPQALAHVRHVTAAFPAAPASNALLQGIWYSAEIVNASAAELKTGFEDKNEELMRLKTEEIINLIAGSQSPQYKDWNADGKINSPYDGYGLLENGEQGYLPNAISHAEFAAQATDATESIKANSADFVVCNENITGWAKQILEKALQLQQKSLSEEMEPLISEIVLLAENIRAGVDSNQNGIIEPIIGEGGADTAYQSAYRMAEMPLLPGEHRIPPPETEGSR